MTVVRTSRSTSADGREQLEQSITEQQDDGREQLEETAGSVGGRSPHQHGLGRGSTPAQQCEHLLHSMRRTESTTSMFLTTGGNYYRTATGGGKMLTSRDNVAVTSGGNKLRSTALTSESAATATCPTTGSSGVCPGTSPPARTTLPDRITQSAPSSPHRGSPHHSDGRSCVRVGAKRRCRARAAAAQQQDPVEQNSQGATDAAGTSEMLLHRASAASSYGATARISAFPTGARSRFLKRDSILATKCAASKGSTTTFRASALPRDLTTAVMQKRSLAIRKSTLICVEVVEGRTSSTQESRASSNTLVGAAAVRTSIALAPLRTSTRRTTTTGCATTTSTGCTEDDHNTSSCQEPFQGNTRATSRISIGKGRGSNRGSNKAAAPRRPPRVRRMMMKERASFKAAPAGVLNKRLARAFQVDKETLTALEKEADRDEAARLEEDRKLSLETQSEKKIEMAAGSGTTEDRAFSDLHSPTEEGAASSEPHQQETGKKNAASSSSFPPSSVGVDPPTGSSTSTVSTRTPSPLEPGDRGSFDSQPGDRSVTTSTVERVEAGAPSSSSPFSSTEAHSPSASSSASSSTNYTSQMKLATSTSTATTAILELASEINSGDIANRANPAVDHGNVVYLASPDDSAALVLNHTPSFSDSRSFLATTTTSSAKDTPDHAAEKKTSRGKDDRDDKYMEHKGQDDEDHLLVDHLLLVNEHHVVPDRKFRRRSTTCDEGNDNKNTCFYNNSRTWPASSSSLLLDVCAARNRNTTSGASGVLSDSPILERYLPPLLGCSRSSATGRTRSSSSLVLRRRRTAETPFLNSRNAFGSKRERTSWSSYRRGGDDRDARRDEAATLRKSNASPPQEQHPESLLPPVPPDALVAENGSSDFVELCVEAGTQAGASCYCIVQLGSYVEVEGLESKVQTGKLGETLWFPVDRKLACKVRGSAPKREYIRRHTKRKKRSSKHLRLSLSELSKPQGHYFGIYCRVHLWRIGGVFSPEMYLGETLFHIPSGAPLRKETFSLHRSNDENEVLTLWRQSQALRKKSLWQCCFCRAVGPKHTVIQPSGKKGEQEDPPLTPRTVKDDNRGCDIVVRISTKYHRCNRKLYCKNASRFLSTVLEEPAQIQGRSHF
ncbi:unnamed protein product [Amoebophrya sp. A25]|nr:unnamed protein product [Amoebophrya sp. A25]|eukprot:GSA25T00020191001.1